MKEEHKKMKLTYHDSRQGGWNDDNDNIQNSQGDFQVVNLSDNEKTIIAVCNAKIAFSHFLLDKNKDVVDHTNDSNTEQKYNESH